MLQVLSLSIIFSSLDAALGGSGTSYIDHFSLPRASDGKLSKLDHGVSMKVVTSESGAVHDHSVIDSDLDTPSTMRNFTRKIELRVRADNSFFYPATFVVLFLGFFFSWGCTKGCCLPFAECLGFFAAVAHIFLQFLPIIVSRNAFLYNALFSKGCTFSLPWKLHFMYASILATASPVLTMSVRGAYKNGEVLALARCNKKIAKIVFPPYLYMISLVGAADQYLDALMTMSACACQWRLAWAMLAVFVCSFWIQAFAACAGTGDFSGFIFSLMGVSPEGHTFADTECFMQLEERQGYQMAVGVARLVTENLPQAYLQFTFATEIGAPRVAYVSIVVSLTMGVKYFAAFLRYMRGRCKPGASERSDNRYSAVSLTRTRSSFGLDSPPENLAWVAEANRRSRMGLE